MAIKQHGTFVDASTRVHGIERLQIIGTLKDQKRNDTPHS